MGKLVEFGLVVTIAGCGLVGAYQAGKLSERQRWRLELAAGNAKLEKQVLSVSVDVVSVDEKLFKEIRDDRARLAEAEETIREYNARKPEPAPGSAADSSDSACRLVPARCLRR